MKKNKVNLFLVGFPKCGTDFLYSLLTKSKEIEKGKKKEINFFNKNFIYPEYMRSVKNDSIYSIFEKGYKHYESYFRWKKNKKYFIDASTVYSLDCSVPEKIKKYNSAAKIIFIVRDPEDMLKSFYYYRKNSVWTKEIGSLDFNLKKKQFLFLSDYRIYLDRYLKHFSRKKIFVTSIETLNNNTNKEISLICQFLKIKKLKIKDIHKINEAYDIRFKWIKLFSRKVIQIINFLNIVFLFKYFEQTLHKIYIKVNHIKLEKKEKISKNVRNKINLIKKSNHIYIKRVFKKNLLK